MPITIRVTLSGDKEAAQALSVLERAWADLSEPFGQIERDAWQIFARRFRAQGPGWQPLSPGYAAWKAAHFPGKPILQASGQLVGQMTGDAGWWHRIGPQRAEFGVSLDYFAGHQYGDPARHLPARPPVDFSPADLDQFAGRVHAYLVRKAEAAGLRVVGGALP
jgi:phage gpG-like protein